VQIFGQTGFAFLTHPLRSKRHLVIGRSAAEAFLAGLKAIARGARLHMTVEGDL
jgi:hypothetical protein